MSDTKTFPVMQMVLSFGLGAVATAGCIAGCGWLMVRQGMTQEAAGPLATSAVCLGSFLGGLFLASFQREKGLIWGIAEGLLFVGVLILLGTLYQSEWQTFQFIRAGLVLMAGMLGGTLGMFRAGRRRR